MKKRYVYPFFMILIGLVLPVAKSWAQPIKTIVYKDGHFDIMGKTIQITNCYPALDNQSLKPIRIKVSETKHIKTIQYFLIQGTVTLQLSYEGNALAITSVLSGKDDVPRIVSPMFRADVAGATNVYRTPVVISGVGGVKEWPDSNTKYSVCHSITGLLPATSGHSLIIGTRDYKKYLSYSYLHPTALNDGKKLLDLSIDTENVAYDNIPVFYITENASPYDGMRQEAMASAKFMGAKYDKPQSYHWCSWYFTYYHLTAQLVSDYLKGFKSIQPPVNIQTFQIDAGYHPHVGDWLEPSFKFPNGIEPSVKEIIANNYKAGIWIGPYMVGNRSKLYKEHPDWILKRNDGSPIVQMKFYGEERLWGSIDEEYLVLDTSNPAVMEYLRHVFRTFRKMGITFFKTDFMYYGWEASNAVKRFTPGKTSSEYQRELFEMIRQEIGPESYWLGCIAPFPVMLGYVDGMRISGDINPNWNGCTNMFDETRGDQHINNVWWQNDPDALIIRSQYSNLTEEETKSVALWVGMTGGVIQYI
jgi:alpha-galactosidase